MAGMLKKRMITQLLPVGMMILAVQAVILSWVGGLTGRELVLYQPLAYVELTGLGITILAGLMLRKKIRMNCIGRAFLYAALPVVLLGDFDLLQRSQEGMEIICVLFSAAGAWSAYLRHTGPGRGIRGIVNIISGILTAALIFWALVSALFMGFGKDGTAVLAESPDGSKIASIYYVDAGATGGEEYLYIRESGEGMNVLIGRLRRFRRYELDMNNWNPEGRVIQWLDQDTVSVDGKQFDVSR